MGVSEKVREMTIETSSKEDKEMLEGSFLPIFIHKKVTSFLWTAWSNKMTGIEIKIPPLLPSTEHQALQ